MKTIAIASGKGGTGKTTFAVNIALYLSEVKRQKVVLSDLDVEEPNSHLFFNLKPNKISVYNYQPNHNKETCTYCSLCAKSCEFKALIAVNNYWRLFPEMCHGCTVCEYVCPTNSISQGKREIGHINKSEDMNIEHIAGKLNIGETLTSEMVKQTKEFTIKNADEGSIIIYDCPPGTTCPAVNAVKDTDLTILIAEPTPFGFNDFKLMVSVLEEIKIIPLVIINKYNGKSDLEDFCVKKNFKIIGRIPFMKNIAEGYSKGNLLYKIPEMEAELQKISLEILK